MKLKFKYFLLIYKDKEKKTWLKIIKESIQYGWVKKEMPNDYFRKYLYRTDVENYKDYLSLNQYYSIINSPKMRFPEIATILNNKLSFAIFCEKNNLPTPKLISYNLRNSYFFNNELKIIKEKTELLSYFQKIFSNAPIQKLFLKLLESSGGNGCIMLDKLSLENQIEQYGNVLLNNSYIHQEVICQHSEINKINSHAVNSLRIDTYLDAKKNIHVLSVLMRFGLDKSFIDNASGGGVYISVNTKTGKLQGKARKDFVKNGNTYLKHPNSNISFENFKIPYLEEACELAKSASELLPTRIIGWDIAISNEGPLIIEGNEGPSLHMTDVAYGGYCKHPLMKEILNEIKVK